VGTPLKKRKEKKPGHLTSGGGGDKRQNFNSPRNKKNKKSNLLIKIKTSRLKMKYQ
jgi:hypothetical protein